MFYSLTKLATLKTTGYRIIGMLALLDCIELKHYECSNKDGNVYSTKLIYFKAAFYSGLFFATCNFSLKTFSWRHQASVRESVA